MKVIILLGGYGSRMRPHTWSRPKALMNVAGKTTLGHILDEMSPLLTEEVVFVVGYKGDEIRTWIEANYSHLDTHFVVQDQALGQAHAVWLCRHFLSSGEVVIAFGDGVLKTNFADMSNTNADATFLVKEVDNPQSFGVVKLNEAGFVTDFVEKPDTDEHKRAVAGINWFKSATQIRDAIDTVIDEDRQTKGEYYMADAYGVMLERGAKIRTQLVTMWEDAGQPQNILHTNKRLLSTGSDSRDALERSFGEGFTVVPPVYLHPDCDIENSVVGPYVSVEANTIIRGSIIRNSLIDANTTITDAVLDGALVGENATVTGRGKALFVGDKSRVEL